MPLKIGIIGKMGSGKTTAANHLKTLNDEFIITSFASKIKQIAGELFNMKTKDRHLLQQIGTKMREIDNDVWINYVIKTTKDIDFAIIDDVRFVNEMTALRKNGWYLIKLNISPKLQRQRLIYMYPDTWQSHLNKASHESETNMDTISDVIYDLVLNVDDDIVHSQLSHFYNTHMNF